MDNIYTNDEYIIKNPSLHEEDSPWKIEKVLPLVDRFIGQVNKKEICILDVGGGAGLILKAISDHIRRKYGIKVNKFALDLSPGMLKAQKQNNNDLCGTYNENICKTSIENKKFDLVLMVDILEHVPDDLAALIELARISKYVILKVPLETNLFSKIKKIGKGTIDMQRLSKEKYGHVNFYFYYQIIHKIKNNLGESIFVSSANAFDYLRKSQYYNKTMSLKYKLFCWVAASLSKILPPSFYLNLFGDFAVILVESY